MPMNAVLPTTVVGSYPQPDWLIDRANLKGRLPPRVRAREIWRVAENFLEAAQDDATLIAIRDMERAGIDIISDGEMRRESYSNRFSTALSGIDIDKPGTALRRTGETTETGRAARRRVPAPQHRSPDQDHHAWPLHYDAAGAERLLQGRGRARDGLRRCGQCRDA
jgi:methionine synthase II (cobalamin-independent)